MLLRKVQLKPSFFLGNGFHYLRFLAVLSFRMMTMHFTNYYLFKGSLIKISTLIKCS